MTGGTTPFYVKLGFGQETQGSVSTGVGSQGNQALQPAQTGPQLGSAETEKHSVGVVFTWGFYSAPRPVSDYLFDLRGVKSKSPFFLLRASFPFWLMQTNADSLSLLLQYSKHSGRRHCKRLGSKLTEISPIHCEQP